MDLSTVGSKIKDRQYASMAEFEADIRLIVENCLLFNGAEAVPSLEALKMEKLFDKLLRDLGG